MSYALAAGLHGHDKDHLSKTHLGHEPDGLQGARRRRSEAGPRPSGPARPGRRLRRETADIIIRLHGMLNPRLGPGGLLTVYETLERPLVPVLADMEHHGIKVDPAVLRDLSQRFAVRIAEKEEEAHRSPATPSTSAAPSRSATSCSASRACPAAARPPPAPGPPTPPRWRRWATKGLPLPLAILEHRQLSKLKNTYTDALVAAMDPGHRVHTTYMKARAQHRPPRQHRPQPAEHPHPHRGRPRDPHRLRRRARPRAGQRRLQPDRAAAAGPHRRHPAAETRLRREPGYSRPDRVGDVRRARRGHAARGPQPREGHQFRHHLRHQRFGLSNQLGIGQSEAGEYIKTYFERFPGIRDYMEGQKRFVREHGFVTTLFGRKIHVPDIRAKSFGQRQFAERVSINAPIQGTAADIIRRAMIRVPPALAAEGLNARMLLSVHDELIIEAP
jgi:DNA polymerase-1